MIVRSCATFTADLPDDQIENEEGTSIVQYGGKSVAEAIGAVLKRLGCVVDPVRYGGDHGWELDITCGKRRLWCQVTIIDCYVIDFEDLSFISKLLGRSHPIYLDILKRLALELGRDPRFRDVLWFRKEEVLTGVSGSKEPVSAD
jgi:hypothetical protein